MIKKKAKKHLTFTLTFISFFCVNIVDAQETYNSEEDIKGIFEREYKAYVEAGKLDDEEFPHRSTSFGPRSVKHLQNIGKLGATVLPYLMEKMIETENMSLNLSINIITRKAFTRPEWTKGIPMDSRGETKLYINWWNIGRKRTPKYFAERYSKWKKLKEQGNEKERVAKAELENIRALGIAALPMIIEKVKQGDKELVPVISRLTDGQVDPNTSISQCFAWWRDNKQKWLIPFPNNRPIAKAGKDKTATSDGTVQLDGSGSSDEDKDELTYTWAQTAGPPVKLSDENGVKPTFKAPEVKVPTALIFELKVNDAGDVFKSCPTPNSESKPDTIKITVNPKD